MRCLNKFFRRFIDNNAIAVLRPGIARSQGRIKALHRHLLEIADLDARGVIKRCLTHYGYCWNRFAWDESAMDFEPHWIQQRYPVLSRLQNCLLSTFLLVATQEVVARHPHGPPECPKSSLESNRIFDYQIRDFRSVQMYDEMFGRCIEHLKAMSGFETIRPLERAMPDYFPSYRTFHYLRPGCSTTKVGLATVERIAALLRLEAPLVGTRFAYCVRSLRAYEIVMKAVEADQEVLDGFEKAMVLEEMFIW